MRALALLYHSTIGKKIIMSITGIILVLFLVGHMVGNLQFFAAPKEINGYAHFLKEGLGGEMGKLLWVARIVLLGSVGLHVLMAIQLHARTRSARPVEYRKRRWTWSNVASRSMLWGGLFLAFFIVFHLLHFTTGDVGFEDSSIVQAQTVQFHLSEGMYDSEAGELAPLHQSMFFAFRDPLITLVYVAAMIFLGLHLYHGVWSMFQTLGFNHPRWNDLLRRGTRAGAVVLVFGFMVIPVTVFTGIYAPPAAYVELQEAQPLDRNVARDVAAQPNDTAAASLPATGTILTPDPTAEVLANEDAESLASDELGELETDSRGFLRIDALAPAHDVGAPGHDPLTCPHCNPDAIIASWEARRQAEADGAAIFFFNDTATTETETETDAGSEANVEASTATGGCGGCSGCESASCGASCGAGCDSTSCGSACSASGCASDSCASGCSGCASSSCGSSEPAGEPEPDTDPELAP